MCQSIMCTTQQPKDNQPNLKMSKGPKQVFSQRKYTNGQQIREKMPNIISHEGNLNPNHNETPLSHPLEDYNVGEKRKKERKEKERKGK